MHIAVTVAEVRDELSYVRLLVEYQELRSQCRVLEGPLDRGASLVDVYALTVKGMLPATQPTRALGQTSYTDLFVVHLETQRLRLAPDGPTLIGYSCGIGGVMPPYLETRELKPGDGAGRSPREIRYPSSKADSPPMHAKHPDAPSAEPRLPITSPQSHRPPRRGWTWGGAGGSKSNRVNCHTQGRNRCNVHAAVGKSRTLAAIHQSASATSWPTAEPDRSLQELFDRAEVLREEQEANEKRARHEEQLRAVAERERDRLERMQKMVEDPSKWIRQATKLVEARGTQNYQSAAELLADLREAIGGEEGERMARKHAARLVKKHPTLTLLKSSLRQQRLFD